MRIYDGTGEHVAGEVTSRAPVQRRSVGVADYAVTVDETTLITSGLGSCVAVGLFDGSAAAGLIHVMLPSADDRGVDNPAKYADTGIRTLVDALEEAGSPTGGLFAKLAGGSEMIAFNSQERSIGDRNVEAVRDVLEELDIPVLGEDVGGDEGRTVQLTRTGEFTVRTAQVGERTL